MADFYNIKVADIYKETEDTSVVTFDIPTELREVFKFTQGQHLTLKADIPSKLPDNSFKTKIIMKVKKR